MNAAKALRALLAAVSLAPAVAVAAPRVMSLDSCADQYVLALAPRDSIVGLSYRAVASDSYMRAEAKGLPLRRATFESLVAARPDVVVRLQHILRNARDIKKVIQRVGPNMAPAQAHPSGAAEEAHPLLAGKRILVVDADVASLLDNGEA